MKTVASYSIKGGVGKTTTAVNLACEAARSGARVLVWDLDPQGAASYFLRVRPKVRGGAKGLAGNKGELATHIRATEKQTIEVVPADFSLRNLDLRLDDVDRPERRIRRLLGPVSENYDVAILDCPPAISLASESVFFAADALLVPTVPSSLSVRTLEQLEAFLEGEPQRPLLLPFLSMYDARKQLHRTTAATLREQHPMLLDATIPVSAFAERMGVERSAIASFAPRAALTLAYRALWAEVAEHLWSPSDGTTLPAA